MCRAKARRYLRLRSGRQGKEQRHRQNEECQRSAESHGHLARLAWTEKIDGVIIPKMDKRGANPYVAPIPAFEFSSTYRGSSSLLLLRMTVPMSISATPEARPSGCRQHCLGVARNPG
jgi:hypothetical protein